MRTRSDRDGTGPAAPAVSRLSTLAVLGIVSAAATPAFALQVFACEPEWGALVRALAPEARVTVATHARQDPHHVEARPALISALRRADLAVCTGASLEAGWLPALQQRAANPAVRDGAPGLFLAAESAPLIDAHAQVDRTMGDVHAEGNPHLHLDPELLATVASDLARRLGQIDPARGPDYVARLAVWQADWASRQAAWIARAAPLAGRTVVAQHTGYAYLFRWLGMVQVADLEPLPGLPPTIGHLQQVLRQVRDEPPIAIVQSLYQDPQAGRWLADRLDGVPLRVLPSTVTPEGPASDLPGLFDALIDALVGTLPGPRPGSGASPTPAPR